MQFRRCRFIEVAILAAIAISRINALAVRGAESNQNAPQRFSFEEIHMGAPWKIVLYAADELVANRAAKAAFARIEELNRVLSDYDPRSELSRLSATAPSAEAIHVGDDLWNVLAFSQRLSEKSAGAFDITIGPL